MTSPLSIRRAGAEQVEQIRDLSVRAYAKWVPITPRKPRPMTADYSASVLTNQFDFLFEGERLVGLIETVQQDADLMIVNVAVEPDCQGKGYGTHLMRHAEQIARELGLSGTRLYTNKLMTENIALYERLGYRFEKETHHDLGTVAIHMVRSAS
ncbi:GNAT family N-acetyltransferase [Sphingomonas sp.]|uniref:GNAT family N-acetyltransferase n=1 Tax=Sphingomonas sp. TaxID=28214 RepID=UPI0035AFE048